MDNFNIITDIHTVLYRKTYPTWEIPTRAIKDHELVFVVSGKGTIKFGEKKTDVKSGTIVYFPPNTKHSLKTNGDDPMCFYAVHFNVFKYIIQNKTDITQIDLLPIELISSMPNAFILKNILKNINTLWKNKLFGYTLACNSLLQQLIFEIFTAQKSNNINYGSWKKVENIILYIQDNINRKITLSELSEIADLSYAYLSLLFKETTGYNVTEFINKLKIDKAKELLIEGRYKIKNISEALGFDDQFYFSRVFKKTEGISPTEYCNRYI